MQKLSQFAKLFGAGISIDDGRLNYATFALVLEQALTMTPEQFHDRLDYIYPTVSYDNFGFIECLHKLNMYVNSATTQSELTRKNLLGTVAQIRSAIVEAGESENTYFSAVPKISWRERLSVKPKKAEADMLAEIVRQTRREEAPELPRYRFVFVVRGNAEDCVNPDCPFHHPPQNSSNL